MYKQLYQVLNVLTLVAWLMVPATHAQSIMLKADIPFKFTVGDTQLPSGEYFVKKLHSGVIQVQGKSSAFVMTTGGDGGNTSGGSKLVFNRYGDQYFLSRIWAPGMGHELRKSRLEREVAQRLSNGGATVIAAAPSR